MSVSPTTKIAKISFDKGLNFRISLREFKKLLRKLHMEVEKQGWKWAKTKNWLKLTRSSLRIKRYLVGLFLVLLVLALFVPLHQSFSNNQIANQTRENYIADNFFLNHYNWEKPSIIAVDFGTQNYLTNKLSVYYYISNQWLSIVDKADTILYTPQMVGLELGNYSSMESLSKGEGLNLLYNDGSSFVLIKPS